MAAAERQGHDPRCLHEYVIMLRASPSDWWAVALQKSHEHESSGAVSVLVPLPSVLAQCVAIESILT